MPACIPVSEASADLLLHIATGRLQNLGRIRDGGGEDAGPAPAAALQPAPAAGGMAAGGTGEVVIDRAMLRKLLSEELSPNRFIGDDVRIRDEGVAALGAAAESFLTDVFHLAGKVRRRLPTLTPLPPARTAESGAADSTSGNRDRCRQWAHAVALVPSFNRGSGEFLDSDSGC